MGEVAEEAVEEVTEESVETAWEADETMEAWEADEEAQDWDSTAATDDPLFDEGASPEEVPEEALEEVFEDASLDVSEDNIFFADVAAEAVNEICAGKEPCAPKGTNHT